MRKIEAMAVLLLVAFGAGAQDWTGMGADQLLSNNANWSAAPAAGATIRFGGTGTWASSPAQVDGAWGLANNSIIIGAGALTPGNAYVEVLGGANLTGANLLVGSAGGYHPGQLTLRSGSTINPSSPNSGSLSIGREADGSGELIVEDGATFQWSILTLNATGVVRYEFGEASASTFVSRRNDGGVNTLNGKIELDLSRLLRDETAQKEYTLISNADTTTLAGDLVTWITDGGEKRTGTGSQDSAHFAVQNGLGIQWELYMANGGKDLVFKVMATPAGPAPTAPEGLTAVPLNAYVVELSWTDVATNELGYRVERRTGGGPFELVAELPAHATSHTEWSLDPETAYTYRIQACNAAGCSPYGNEALATTPANSPRPNVLFIMVDDLRPALGAYGDPLAITPQMDTLAAQGRLFTRHHVQNAQCQQSRAALFSGLRPDSTGVHLLDDFLQTKLPGTTMLAQHFWRNGYRTAGVSKIQHNNPYAALNYSEGWKSHGVSKNYFQTSPIDKSGEEDALLATGKQPWQFRVYATERAPDADCTSPGSEIIGDRYRDGQALIKAMASLEQLSNVHDTTGESFFLAVGFDKPHTPFNAPNKYWKLYDSLTDEQFGFPAIWTGVRQGPEGTDAAALPGGGLDFYSEYESTGGLRAPRDARIAKQGYYACVSWIDDLIGRLLAKLSDLGRDHDTIVVLWGDHGYHLGDHNGFWEKHSNFEMATHAPLIIRVPGMSRPGVQADAIVETVDLFPTLCDLAGLPYPIQPTASGRLEGTSLVPLLDDPHAPFKKAAISQRFGPYNGGQVMRYAYRTARYRYVAWYSRPDLYNPATMGSTIVYEELYDYETDPGETLNHATAPAYAGVMEEFRAIALQGRGWQDRRIAPGTPAAAADFDAWAALYAPFIHARWDPAAHYDNDPAVAAIQYLLGTNPLQDGDAVPTILRRMDGALAFRFPAPLQRTDFSLKVRGTGDLASGAWATDGIALEAAPDAPGMSDALAPADRDAFFLRLEAVPR